MGKGPLPSRARWSHRLVVALTAALAAVASTMVGGVGMAGAHSGEPPGTPTTLADGLVGPLHLDASGRDILVSQSFAGKISRIHDGVVTDLVSEPDAFTGGVANGPFGTVLFLISGQSGSFLKMRLPNGTVRSIADLGAYEAKNNPDQVNTYGMEGLTPECAQQLPPDIPFLPYSGEVDSNPYELAVTPLGTFVADAGGNDILFVTWSGRISTVSVLPPRPYTITAETVAAMGLPNCVSGLTYNFEPVPTDVVIGPRLQLYVSSLPGGPEDASFGARGSVFRINPLTGRSKVIGDGFLGATNLAVAPNGTVYVAEMFGGRISKLTGNGPVTVAQVTDPAAVQWSCGRLYATTDVNGSGKVVRFRA